MEDNDPPSILTDLSAHRDLLEPLFLASNSLDLRETLEFLIEIAKTEGGRQDLAFNNVFSAAIHLTESLPYPSGRDYLLLSLKLLRNLCAGEIANQNSFIASNGVGIVSSAVRSSGLASVPDSGIIRMGLQVLANVSLAGKDHQRAVWNCLFPNGFLALAAVRSRETCDPLCMIVYVCCDGSSDLFAELCGDQGLPIVAEIVRTASKVGFGEDWLKLVISKICLEEIHFPQLFMELHCIDNSETEKEINPSGDRFVTEHAYILNVVSEILSERLNEITVPKDLPLGVFSIFEKSAKAMDFAHRGQSGLPTGSAEVDVLGYSLTILRDICAMNVRAGMDEDLVDAVDTLVASGLLELLLSLLRDLEPPEIIRKARKQSENQEASSSYSSKLCPYTGFRRDIVAVIGNCAYRRKHVQDEIREKNAILLLLQQCVTDEDNPYLREWGIWCMRNLLEGNSDNKQAVAELELQGSVDMPELSGLGLRVELDQKTGRAKLVNVS